MLATEPLTTSAMLGLLSPLPFEKPPAGSVASFHHSDSSWDFNFDTFSDVPIYDEATVTTIPLPTDDVSPSSSLSPPSCSTGHSPATKKERRENNRRIDFHSSWPSAMHLYAKVPTKNNNNNNTTKSSNHNREHQRRDRQASLPSSSSSSSSSPSETNHIKAQQPHTNKVRFAPTLVVRTHNLVLGDHPMCEDGLALELGWDYEDSRDLVEVEDFRRDPHSPTSTLPRWRQVLRPQKRRNTGEATVLSVLERKRRLKEVGGCTEAELEKRRFCARFLLDYDFCEPPSTIPRTPRDLPGTPSFSPGRNGKGNRESLAHRPRAGFVRQSLTLYAAMA